MWPLGGALNDGHARVGPMVQGGCSMDTSGFNLEQVACLLTFCWLTS